MLSKSAARTFFLVGTGLCSVAFIGLTIDTLAAIPKQTNGHKLTPAVIRGKDLWDHNNCMGCHTILGEGAYYAPELTRVYERRGPEFIKAIIRNPEAMYPGQRRMQNYHFREDEIADLVAFFQWIGEMDLNGFPARPHLSNVAVASSSGDGQAGNGGAYVAKRADRPLVYNQFCIACHKLEGQGGAVGPALDGVGSRFDSAYIERWLTDPAQVKPGTKMPKLPLTHTQVLELVAFLSTLTTGSEAAQDKAPEPASGPAPDTAPAIAPAEPALPSSSTAPANSTSDDSAKPLPGSRPETPEQNLPRTVETAP